MGLFGERCTRCAQTNTRRRYQGEPTCPACEARIRLESEVARSCPADGAVMRKEIVLDVLLDRCPACGGVWLDAGELKLIRAAAGREGALQALVGSMVPPG
jgi:hypothetical protein